MTESPEELLARTIAFVQEHTKTYLTSGGTQGHIMNMSHVGVDALVPTLLLKTTGRKSGNTSIVPLIYGYYDGAWVVIASKGGAPEHPGWYFNLQAKPELEFQVGAQAFKGKASIAEGAQRQAIWDYMAHVYPPYNDYQKTSGGRVIPVVLLNPSDAIPVFKA